MCQVPSSPIRALAVLGLVLLAVAGCGGNKKSESSNADTTALPGAKVFTSAGCGGCHTLSAAGSKGTVGPNLDQLRPDTQTVARQVRNGGVGMPSFRKKLSETQINQVAAFVSASTSKGGASSSVAAAFKPDDTKVEDCEQTDFHCFEQAFANISYNDGPKTALDKFDADIKTPGPIERDCHRIAHAIGAGALSHYHGSVGQAFVAGRPSCTSGYYHGILERAFLGVDQNKLGAAARKFCASPEVRKSEFIAYQCVHGLGHGLMIYTGYDLPASLHTCDKLSTQWDATGCTGGVFMENYQSSYGVTSRWVKKNDLIYPCNSVAEKYKYYCYDLVTARILPKVDYNWKKTAAWCRKSEKAWVEDLLPVHGPRRVRLHAARSGADHHDLPERQGHGRRVHLRGGEGHGLHGLQPSPREDLVQHRAGVNAGVLLARDRRDPRLFQRRSVRNARRVATERRASRGTARPVTAAPASPSG